MEGRQAVGAMIPAMERLGTFSDMGYLHAKYLPGNYVMIREDAHSGRQFLGSVMKSRCGNADGYFDEFRPPFVGEQYVDVLSVLRRFRMRQKARNLSGAFLASSGAKDMCGAATLYGTFFTEYTAFDPRKRTLPQRLPPKRGIFTSPAQKGTGYGYVGVGLAPYPQHSVDPSDRLTKLRRQELDEWKAGMVSQNPFLRTSCPKAAFGPNPYPPLDVALPTYRTSVPRPKFYKGPPNLTHKPFVPSSPGKKLGNCKDGCLNKFPEWRPEAYKTADRSPFRKTQQRMGVAASFWPPGVPRSTRTRSLLAQNVCLRVRPDNYHATVVGVHAPDMPSLLASS